jgi:N-dimethylarginine dimethylaminohydrolase
LSQAAFSGLDHIMVGEEEPPACNVLTVGRNVVASGRYRAHAVLGRLGFAVHQIDLSEFVLADGGPTCLALVVEE